MLDPKMRSDVEQAFAYLGEMYPPLWRQLYLGCVEEGFTEQQSFKLLETYIYANSSAARSDDD